MGIKSSLKSGSARRTLSARPTPTKTPIKSGLSNEIKPLPSPLILLGSSSKQTEKNQSHSSPPSSTPSMGSKRNASEMVETSNEASAVKPKRIRKNRPRKPKSGIIQDGISSNSSSSKSKLEVDDEGLEEGEIDGDFSDLFMVDTTPSIVAPSIAYVDSALISPTKLGKDGEPIEDEPALFTLADFDQEEADMLAFADEVAMSESDSEEESDEEDDEVEQLYDDPDTLKRAIAGKITDDSAAKVTGRYYKEADLTRSCGLCGEQGHSSRDCTHSQCFTCGLVDGDHEARNCPVTLVCTSCGSRGHYNRNCPAPTNRNSYGSRCITCSSTLHLASNCPLIWRVYDTTGAKPHSHKITYACANDGSTNDHFIDDCLLPRMHPIRMADASAFNRASLGENPGPPRSSSSYAKRFGAGGSGASGSASSSKRRGADNRREEQDEDDDDDWFASRSKQQQSGDRNDRSNSKGGKNNNSGKRGKVVVPYTGGGPKARANRERKEQLDIDGPPQKGAHVVKGYKKDKNYRNSITNARSLGGGASGSFHGTGGISGGGAQSGGRGRRDDYDSNRDSRRGGGGGGGGGYDSPRNSNQSRDSGGNREQRRAANNSAGRDKDRSSNGRNNGGGNSLSDRMEAPPSRYSGSYF